MAIYGASPLRLIARLGCWTLMALARLFILGLLLYAPIYPRLNAAKQWFRLKRVCTWCNPPRWIGGNPFSAHITHGICPACLARELSLSLKFRSNNN